MNGNIKIMTYNVEFGASVTRGYWQYLSALWKYVIPHKSLAMRWIAKVINTENIDVCTFVEIDGGSIRTSHSNYLRKLANMTVLKKYHFFPVRHVMKFANQGNGILTKFEVTDTKNFMLAHNGENRCLSMSRLDVEGKIITVMTTQLALGKISRKKEIKEMFEIIRSVEGPVILTGDLNTTSDKELEMLKQCGLSRLETTNTFPSWKPRRRIDYIYYSSHFEVLKYYVSDSLKASDHLPIIAELMMKS